MRICNRTGLQAAPIPGRIGFPGHSLTVVVKGLYRLAPGQVTELVDHELAFPTGDLPAEEDEEQPEIRYASDFAFYKPRADLMLVGRCHAPGGAPVPSCRVTFQVGGRGRSLAVFGDRVWRAGLQGSGMSAPEPFTEMELSWRRAYGGMRCPDNPVGRGDEVVETTEGPPVRPLPNIEDLERRIAAPDDRPVPAGFGPVAREWEPRRSRAGTYDDRWLETRWPWFPDDFDWSLFNAAPETLQVDGFLRGDEDVYLENLHPDHPQFQTRLPGVRVRCFLNELPEGTAPPPPRRKARVEWTPPGRDEMAFREIPMCLDTLWIDAEAGLLALVWRGHGPVRDEDHEEVRDLFVTTEPVEEAPSSLADCRALFWRMHDEEEGPVDSPAQAADPLAEDTESPEAAGSPEGAAPPEGAGLALGAAEDEDEEPEEDPYGSLEASRAFLEDLGIDPDDIPPPTEEEKERGKQTFRDLGMDDVVAMLEVEEEDDDDEGGSEDKGTVSGSWTRERVQERYADDGDLQGADLRGLDLSEMELDGANLAGADLGGARLSRSGLARAVLTGAKLAGAEIAGARLAESQLAGCDLEKADLQGASLTGADGTGARLEGADLSGADLEQVVLDEANLRGAILAEARVADASLVGADLAGADLRKAVFDGSDLTGAVLDRAEAREASFVASELADVSAVEAGFVSATLTEVRAADALDLSRACFSRAEATGSVWSGATLAEADFTYAALEGADFSRADLRGADFYAARLRGARFGGAELVDARLVSADAFEASFEKADLTRADLRGANLYGAEFLETRFHETPAHGANLKMTKHG